MNRWIHGPIISHLRVVNGGIATKQKSKAVSITSIQEHSIVDYDGENGLNLLILVSITFPENFIVLNELNQKAYWV